MIRMTPFSASGARRLPGKPTSWSKGRCWEPGSPDTVLNLPEQRHDLGKDGYGTGSTGELVY